MLCPSCSSVVRKKSNFCSRCGHQMPVIVGVDFPFGLRFPSVPNAPGLAAAISLALQAPVYRSEHLEGLRYHVALYDRPHVADLAELHRVAFAALAPRPLIEHTMDGHAFAVGPSIWACLARRLGDDRTEHPEVPHPGCRCHSYFGCLAAQRRQHEMYHRDGVEVFYNGRHGIFPGGEDVEYRALQDSGDLLSLGDALDTSVFCLDRAKVKAEVMNLIKRAGAHRCPLFSPAYLEAQIRKLPEVVEVGSKGWRYLHCAMRGPAVAWSCYSAEKEIETL